MAKVIAQTYTLTIEYCAKLTGILLVTCMILAVIYSWNLYKVISSTIVLHQAEINSARLSGSLDSLDAQYLRLSDRVTPDALKSYGMSQAQVTEYVRKSASLGRVSMSGHEL